MQDQADCFKYVFMHQDEVDQFRFQETAHPPNPWPLFLTDLWLKGRNMG